MSWTKEDASKLLEYHTAQMTVKEIAKKMNKPAGFIRDELNSRGYTPIETKPKPESEFLKKGKNISIPEPRKQRVTITTGIEQKVIELTEQRMKIDEIAKKLGISAMSVSRIRRKYGAKKPKINEEDKPMKAASINQEFDKAINEMIAEAKEKEPAPIAAETDSVLEKKVNDIPLLNDITKDKKCQSLTGIKMLGVLEDLLNELYKESVEITSLNADTDLASIKFNLNGGQYWVSFGPQQEVPVYGKEVRK